MTKVIEYNVSWDECMADMHREPNEGWDGLASTKREGREAKEFYGTRTFGDAVQTAISGWDEGRDAMDLALSLLRQSRQRLNDLTGSTA